MNDHSRVSKAFSKSRRRSRPVNPFLSAYLMTLSKVRILSLMHLLLMKPDWSYISSGNTVLLRFAMGNLIIAGCVKGRQFLIKLGSASFFGISLTIPRLCDTARFPVWLEKFRASVSVLPISFQKRL